MSEPARPEKAVALEILDGADGSLLEIVDHLLNQGVVVTGEVVLGLAGVDLVYLRLSALLCAADRVLPRQEKEELSLAVYAIVANIGEAPEPAGLGTGLQGEPLRLVRCGEVLAVVGDVLEAASPTKDALLAQHGLGRRLAGHFNALLPARYGESAGDEAALVAALAPHARDLAEALEQVRGCAQMTLRVFDENRAEEAAVETPPQEEVSSGSSGPSEPSGPGTRYLEARRREHRRRAEMPEIETLRDALKPLIHAERVERHTAAGPMIGSAYHLVRREDVPAYLEIVAAAAERLPAGCRVRPSGPWLPSAFAPGRSV